MRAERSDSQITLAALVANPSLTASLTPDMARAFLPQLAVLTVAVAGRIVAEPSGVETEMPKLIDVETLSTILDKSRDYVYEHASEWPFTVRLGARDLKFDLNTLNKWLAARTGR
jgi:hypothetical protein